MDLNKHFYINLERRTDRNEETIKELKKIGITKPNRFNAIEHEKGIIGCARSHIACLKEAKKRNWEYVLIFEDDVKFLKPKDTLNKMKKYINSRFLPYDVLLFSGNNKGPLALHAKYPKDLVRVFQCYCCTMYAVKRHYYDTIIDNFEESIKLVLENPEDKTAPHDCNWFKLMARDNFFLTIPLTTVQRESYSDIEERDVNYEGLMLQLS